MAQGPLIPMIGYWRVSLAREDMISPDIQQGAGERWARDHGRRLVRWIGDPDKSGRNLRRRISQAIAAVEAGEAAEIGVYRFDRWGRNTLDSLANVKRAEDAGGAVVSFTEPVDAETAIGRFSRGLAFQMAELQSDQIGDNWRAIHASRIARGLPATGTPRFGYDRLGRVRDPVRANVYRPDMSDPAGERYVPNEITGPILADLYERDVKGLESLLVLVRWLNAGGHLTARGGRWAHASLLQVLMSGFGAGLLRIHDPACKCGREVHQCKRVFYLPGAHKAVIDGGERGGPTWQAFLERHAELRQLPSRLHEPVHALSGLLRCGTCGYRLSVSHQYGQSGYGYYCPRFREQKDCATGVFVRRDAAEAKVRELLEAVAEDAEAEAQVARERARMAKRARTDTSRLTAKEARLRGALSRLLARQALDEATPPEAYDSAKKDLLGQLEETQTALKAARATETKNVTEFLPGVLSLLEKWDFYTPAAKRHVLGTVIDRIVVTRTGYRKPPDIRIVPVWETVTGP